MSCGDLQRHITYQGPLPQHAFFVCFTMLKLSVVGLLGISYTQNVGPTV